MTVSKNVAQTGGQAVGDNHSDLLEALQVSEAQRRAILDGFPGIMFLFDRDLKAQWLNREGIKIYPDGLGKSCHELFCTKGEDCEQCVVRKSLMTGQVENSARQTVNISGEGDEVVFNITSSPVKGDGRQVTGAIVIAQNVTERYRMEKQLRQTQKMEAIGTLAGGVAHDFNNVLTPIMGYTEIIRLKLKQLGFEEQVVYDYLGEILKAAKRAKGLVEQVLTFSRSMEKREVLQYLHPIVKEVMKLLRVTLPSTIVIHEHISESCGKAMVDPVQLHQVLINLCNNAAQAMGGGHGELTVRLTQHETGIDERLWLELSVEDTGCGIEADHLERIFEPYFTTREKSSGTGMGLAMVHGIISRQGGHIKVESELGRGSIFRVYLPVARQRRDEDRGRGTASLQGGSGSILLIDDEEQVVQVTGEILRSLGYNVVGKTSAVEALSIFNQDPDCFDLILTDLTMPQLTGLELSERVKAVRANVPVILFTGYSDQVSKDAAVAAGIESYCMKPISMRDLSDVVRVAMTRQRGLSDSVPPHEPDLSGR